MSYLLFLTKMYYLKVQVVLIEGSDEFTVLDENVNDRIIYEDISEE